MKYHSKRERETMHMRDNFFKKNENIMFKKKKPSLDGYSSRPEIRDSKLRTDHRILPI